MDSSSKSGAEQERSRVLVRTLACVLQKLVDVNRKLDTPSTQIITKFHASRPPSISVADYLERINKYASCSPECLVLALIYVDRLIQQGRFALTPLNVHRVLITAVMLAAKFFDDQYFNNLYYAKVGGVPCKEINSLEVEFLFLVNFSLHVPGDVYQRYHTELMNHAHHAACPCCGGGAALPLHPISVPRVPSPVYAPAAAAPRLAATGFGVGAGAVAVVPQPVPVAHATAGAMQALLAAQQAAHQQEQEAAVAAACSSIAGVVLRGLGGGRSVSPVMVQPPVTPPAYHVHQTQAQAQPAFTSYFSYDASVPSPPHGGLGHSGSGSVGLVSASGLLFDHENPQAAPPAQHHTQQQQPLYAPVPVHSHHYHHHPQHVTTKTAYYPTTEPALAESHHHAASASAAAAAAAAFWAGDGSGSGNGGGRASSVTPTPVGGMYAPPTAYGHHSSVEAGTVLVHPQRGGVLPPSGGSGLLGASAAAAKLLVAAEQQAQAQQQQAAAAAAVAALGYPEYEYGGGGQQHYVQQQPQPAHSAPPPQRLASAGSRVLMSYPACYGVQVLMNT